jgi:hypothetical protein
MKLRLKLTIYVLITAFPLCAFAQLGADTVRNIVVKAGSLYLYRSPQTMIPLTPTGKDRFSTDIGGFSGEKGEIIFLSGNKQMSIYVSRAAGVIFNKL